VTVPVGDATETVGDNMTATSVQSGAGRAPPTETAGDNVTATSVQSAMGRAPRRRPPAAT